MSKLEALRNYLELRHDLKDNLRGMVRLCRALPEFLRERVTVEQAEEEIKKALESREERFLELIRTRIYEHPASPYLKLLKLARCEFADLQAQVRRYGLEGTLERLAREGVYLTSDEFKGKKEVVRGGESFRVCPADFQRPDQTPGFVMQSSGTGNRPVRSLLPLDWLTIRAFGAGVFFSAHNLFSYSHALYDAILPGSGVSHLLINAKLGKATDRWFARKVPTSTRLAAAYHYLNTDLTVMMGKWFDPGFPRPEFVDVGEVYRILGWISKRRREGKACYITTVASSAARIARVARETGVSLDGTKFNVAGEPFTEAKEKAVEQVGAVVTSRYSYGGHIPVGHGCANPLERDEVHVNDNILAAIPHPRPLAEHAPSIHPLLVTTLHAAAPHLLLNVGNGDYATFLRRDCGCCLERVGLTLHLHHIRSYEKFTSEGMNYFYGDLYEFFEKTLPSEFGGGPGDYQLVEEEDENGQTRLSLVVHPQVGEVEEAKLIARLQQGLSSGSRGNRFMTKVWQNAGTLRIRREAPFASARGKILPLHIPR